MFIIHLFSRFDDDDDDWETPNMPQRQPVIDARNEQEFPSLGNGPAIPIRQAAPLSARVMGSRGIAKTKENFPALGSSVHSTNSASASGYSVNVRPNVSNFKPPETASALFKAGKPKSIQPQPSIPKPTIGPQDFPSLASGSSNPFSFSKTTAKPKFQEKASMGGGGSGSNSRTELQNDFIEPSATFSMAVVSAKHRGMVTSYESVGSENGSKISIMQQAESSKKASKEPAPELSSSDSFPTLSKASASPASAPQWITNGSSKSKKPPQMSKKLKVAPAPLLEPPAQSNVPTRSAQKETKIADKVKATTEKPKEKAAVDAKTVSKKAKKNTSKTDNPKIVEQPKSKTAKGKIATNEDSKVSRSAGKTEADRTISQTSVLDSTTNTTSSETVVNGNLFASVAAAQLPPPPGFTGGESIKPPPGFALTSASNDNAFTYQYIPPSNAAQRNQVLVSFFQRAMSSPGDLEEFLQKSRFFRENIFSSESFYEHCEATLGPHFNNIFVELLVLLPDIEKQQVISNQNPFFFN